MLGVIHVKYFSLPNIILDCELVAELLQFKLSDRIMIELDKILAGEQYRNRIQKGYNEIRHLLSKPGVSDRIAGRIIDLLRPLKK